MIRKYSTIPKNKSKQKGLNFLDIETFEAVVSV